MEPYRGYVYCVLGWVIWCTLHSTLISITVTNYAKEVLGRGFQFYRLLYNMFSLLTFVPLLYYSASLEPEPVFRWHGSLLIIQYFLIAVSVFLFIAGGWSYSILNFLGIQQMKTGRESGSLSEQGTFVVSGIHKIVRHPWYLGGMIIVWTGNVSVLSFIINIVITAYFIIGTYLEERKLILEFGDQYREYQRNVSMFSPYKWLKAKIVSHPRL